jgi:hypothetical protein
MADADQSRKTVIHTKPALLPSCLPRATDLTLSELVVRGIFIFRHDEACHRTSLPSDNSIHVHSTRVISGVHREFRSSKGLSHAIGISFRNVSKLAE